MRIVIIGTGTDVGKTHVSAALIASLHREGKRVRGWKPLASGVIDRCADAEELAQAADRTVDAPFHVFRDPVSLHLAARREGVTIDVAAIAARAEQLSSDVDVLVVETAGGLFSPLTPRLTNADLLRALKPDAQVLVAPDRLGVLHDLGATLRAAHLSNLPPSEVALSTPPMADESTGTNEAEILDVLALSVAAVFPRASLAARETHDAARALARRLRV